MQVGVVKWFNNTKGFGFINLEGSTEDIFVHFSVIEMEGYRSLKAGQKVNVEINNGEKGASATKIVPIVE